MRTTYRIRAKVWLWPGQVAPWHFVNVDKKTSTEIKEKHVKVKRGFGSVRVKATIGKTSWSTSIFPDKQSGTYLLPLKAPVRHSEGVGEGDTISFTIQIV